MKVREGHYSELNRNAAFQSILDELGPRQGDVFNVIRVCGPVSNEEIAKRLGIYPHQVTPRVLELRQLGLVEHAGDTVSPTSNKKVSLWRINPEGKQLNLFN